MGTLTFLVLVGFGFLYACGLFIIFHFTKEEAEPDKLNRELDKMCGRGNK